MHNWVMQVLWLDRDAAGGDTADAGAVRVERERTCAGERWLDWNTFTLHGLSINMLRVFIWVVPMSEKCKLKMNTIHIYDKKLM